MNSFKKGIILIVVILAVLLTVTIVSAALSNSGQESKENNYSTDVSSDISSSTVDCEISSETVVDDVSLAVSYEFSDNNSRVSAPDFSSRKGATQEEAEQTFLTTDKTSYNIDEKITFTIKAPFEDDYLTYGYDYFIQYYDDETDEWKNSDKEFYYNEIAIYSLGSGKLSFYFSERAYEVAEKYRITQDVRINDFNVTAVSNEFTIYND